MSAIAAETRPLSRTITITITTTDALQFTPDRLSVHEMETSRGDTMIDDYAAGMRGTITVS
jgi:hypothetical protein